MTRHFDETQERIFPLSIPHYQHFPLYVVPDNLNILISYWETKFHTHVT